ncbi:hypothetical protein KI659_09900 [Litoribacter alkaliphilus]|uniref:DUF4340 domain-containing protein n=1 Tax=Litoribacter ruber TaxID=702568 RepID=A0AAP2CGQ4_9BACT|nr:hypothetical protein [Litoribacter alkaliphilus]MBS9524328.1 hypothetical protein [Litoribacter alkaliphilus]
MKKLALLIIACLIFQVGMGQDRIYQRIAEQLGIAAPEVKQLWPYEDEVMEIMDPESKFKVAYRLPFKQGKASEISFEFETIKLLESTEYNHERVDLDTLKGLVKEEMPEGFQLEFEQESHDGFGMLFAKDEYGQDSEIYFFAKGEEKSELLYFRLGSKESRHLRVDLNARLSSRKVGIFEKLQSKFSDIDFEIKEIWSPQEAYKMSHPENNPKGIRVENVGLRTKIPLPLTGMEDLEVQVETKQLIDGVLLTAKKEQDGLSEFGTVVSRLIPEGFENQISHRSGERSFELYTMPQAKSDLILFFSQSDQMVLLYYAEVEKGADYIDNLILEINKKLKTITT